MVVCVTKDRMKNVHYLAKRRNERVSDTIDNIVQLFLDSGEFQDFLWGYYSNACLNDTENVSRNFHLTETTENALRQLYIFFYRQHVVNAILDWFFNREG